MCIYSPRSTYWNDGYSAHPRRSFVLEAKASEIVPASKSSPLQKWPWANKTKLAIMVLDIPCGFHGVNTSTGIELAAERRVKVMRLSIAICGIA